jgi:enoyl-CoA hydratase
MAGTAIFTSSEIAESALRKKRSPPLSAILYERSGHLAHIRLNRPDHDNRFTMEMFRTFGLILTEVDADPELRCTLVTANGKDFSIGIDVPDVLPNWAAGKSPFDEAQVTPTGVTGPRRKKPMVTAINGNCFNVGLELALASDICVAAENARFAFHEVLFGTYPFGGGLFRLIRAAGWGAAMRYALTAEEFDAAAAFDMNVVALVCPPGEVEPTGMRLARKICQAPPLAVQAALAQANTWADEGDAAAFAHSVPDIIRLLNSRDAAEAMRATIEGRAPVFSGH